MKFETSQETERIVSRHAIILGDYELFVNFVWNRNKQWLFIIIWIKAGKSLTHSGCHWEKNFLQKMVDIHSSNNAYLISIRENPSVFETTFISRNCDDSYCLLPFSFNLKIISLISPHLISFLFKMYSRKVVSPNYYEISKNQKRIGRFVWFQKSYKGNFYFEPCFQLLKILDLGQLEVPTNLF